MSQNWEGAKSQLCELLPFQSNSITATQQGDSRKLGGLLSHLAQLPLLQKGFRAKFWSTGTKRGQMAKQNISLGFDFIASETSKQKFWEG